MTYAKASSLLSDLRNIQEITSRAIPQLEEYIATLDQTELPLRDTPAPSESAATTTGFVFDAAP